MTQQKFLTITEYFASLNELQLLRLEEIRALVLRIAPQATEVISYNMPAFRYKGMLIYYAAHRSHIGFYPASATVLDAFEEELKNRRTSKGTIQLSLEEEIPEELLEKIIRYRVAENDAKEQQKRLKK